MTFEELRTFIDRPCSQVGIIEAPTPQQMYAIHLKQWEHTLACLHKKRDDIMDTLRNEPRSAYFQNIFREVQQEISNHYTNKPTMNKELSFAEQLMENHNNGLFTVVQDKSGDYMVYSTLDYNGRIRTSDWCDTEDEALKEMGENSGDEDCVINDVPGIKIVRTFSPVDYMKECGKKNTKEIKDAIETLKKAGVLVDGKILNLS
jgi:hypothetical protein